MGRTILRRAGNTVEQECLLSGSTRAFVATAGNYLLRVAVDLLSRKYRFSPGLDWANIPETDISGHRFRCCKTRWLYTVKRQNWRRRNRREKIDAAIAEFGAAIDEALDAIEEEYFLSLVTTCENMSELADETLNRMTAAAAAANETAQRVKVTGEATEQLSASINNIGGGGDPGLGDDKSSRWRYTAHTTSDFVIE